MQSCNRGSVVRLIGRASAPIKDGGIRCQGCGSIDETEKTAQDRSHVAKAEGLTEDLVSQLFDDESSKRFSEREKAALRYADAVDQKRLAISIDSVLR